MRALYEGEVMEQAVFGHMTSTKVSPSSTSVDVYPPEPKAPPGITVLPNYSGQVDKVHLEPGHNVIAIRWIWQETNSGVMYVTCWIKVMKWKE